MTKMWNVEGPASDGSVRRSLILSGGGMRLSYQAGVLVALEQAGVRFNHIDATSGGALNLAMLLSGLSPAEMCDRWRTVDLRRTLSLLPLRSYLDGDACLGLGGTDGFTEYLFPHLGIDFGRIRAEHGVEGTFNVLNYTRKVNEVIGHRELDPELLVAGMSLPGVMPPVSRGDALYLDAAFVRDANLMEGVRRGAEELWVVWGLGNTGEYRGGALHIYIQMLEMAANGKLNEEFERIAELNDRITRGDSPYGQSNPIRLHLIRPAHPLPLDPDLYLGRVDADELIRRGYADAKEYLDRRAESGMPLQPETIIMTTAATGITFTETMKGPFTPGETDPAEGAGAAARSQLAMHATVTVRDLDRFIADPQHAGEIIGTIDYEPLGIGIPTGRGVFRLFAPGDAPRTTYMVYELPFTHEGQDYYLAGRKEVRDDPGFDLWSDTTTLYTRLHRGTDVNGPVIGAGVLSLTAAEFGKVMASVRALDASTPAEAAALIARFGRFFAGQLWATYVAPPAQ